MVLAMYLGTIDVGGFAQWCEPDRSPVVELEAHCTCPTGTLAFSSPDHPPLLRILQAPKISRIRSCCQVTSFETLLMSSHRRIRQMRPDHLRRRDHFETLLDQSVVTEASHLVSGIDTSSLDFQRMSSHFTQLRTISVLVHHDSGII